MQFQRLSFSNKDGRRLAARLDLPADEKPAAYAIFAHCFTCTKNFNAVVNIDRALAAQGLAVLRFDFTGLGESEGDFSETSFSSNVSDLVAAAEFLRDKFEAPKILIGHSLGGAAVLRAAAAIPSILAVATIGAPADLSHVIGFLENGGENKWEETGDATVNLYGKLFKIGKPFLEDLRDKDMEETIRELGKPLLIFHSPLDNIVGIENAGRIFRAARHPKSFISLDKADHLLSDREDSLYVGSVLAAWAKKYLGISEKIGGRRDLSDNRVVARVGKSGFQTEIVANGHALIADEPIAVGGGDTGPNPYDLLVAALGACTAMTIRMYADKKKLPLDAVTVRLKHQKIHAEDCIECTGREGGIDFIEREIELQGDLEAAMRQKILEIADKCPVHRTLKAPAKIETKLKG